MLSQKSGCKSIVYMFSLVLIIGISSVAFPAYADGASTESEGLPGSRVGGGTRVIGDLS